MYPESDLRELRERKAALQRRITERRWQTAAAAAPVADVLGRAEEWIERFRQWRKMAELVLPFFAAATRRGRWQAPRAWWRTAIRWAILAWRITRAARPFTGAARAG